MADKKELTEAEITEKHKELDQWELEDNVKLTRDYSFKNFKQALDFTNQVGEVAEVQNHHPDIYLTWGKVSITIQTHEAGGLTEKDFTLAKSIDQLN